MWLRLRREGRVEFPGGVILAAMTFIVLGMTGLIAGTLSERDAAFIGKRANWWAFQLPVRHPVPNTANAWVRTPVDAFLLEAMTQKGLTPSHESGRAQLLRRVTLDLTGLPPAAEDVAAFLNDHSPDAYAKVVDRLLASPRYGERWAMRWLDVVRYADTNGYEIDAERANAWRYRDYVIRSFNQDKPYNKFIKEQLAGDEIWPGDAEALIATGFLRAGPEHLVAGNQDEEMNRQEVLTEMTTIVGSALLGMTVQCARCHNHKFDPIPQSDHYRLQAVFAATAGKDVSYATDAEKQAAEFALKAHKERLAPIEKAIKEMEAPFRKQLQEDKKRGLDEGHLAALTLSKDQRTKAQEALAKEAKEQIEPTWDEVLALVPPDLKAKRAELRRQMHAINLEAPAGPPEAYGVVNLDKAPETHILKVGDHKNKLDIVPAGLPQVLVPPSGEFPQTAAGRRKALAEWLVSRENPLPARVMVNRIWQFRFGVGLVGTPNDFGMLGARPSNAKLLDWLATEFAQRGYSVKAMDRLLVTSAAYRQASSVDPTKEKIDPENKLLWRMNRRRLEGEAIRDAVLMASGALNLKMGGPSVKPPIEQDVYDLIFSEFERDNLWPLAKDPGEAFRRSIYLINKRTTRLPMFANFDQPDAMTSCAARSVSVHALQALTMINSDFMRVQSRKFAERLAGGCRSKACVVDHAYRVALARGPSTAEVRMAREFFESGGLAEDIALALLNRNEFVYIP